ncbi:MAG: S49 family peptidase [Burkholderiales bacterium]|jgi:protease-4|nr:putative signal peptide peptidase SppA [Betaproteobacteria bacterium MOLA814]|tara:strand:+ start:603 stop:1601 length:999 start_codon:yes stop_codon:yes gene_type:complete
MTDLTTPNNTTAATSSTTAAPASGWEREALRDMLQEHVRAGRSARRWSWFKRGLWLLVIVGFAGWWMMQSSKSSAMPTSSAHTALVVVEGVIASDAEASAQNINRALQNAFEDKGAKAVVMLINSPGGSPVQAGMVFDEIRRLKALHNKPLYAVVEETCASAAYYIAAGADDIFVDKASVVGSIGVLMDGFGFTGLMDKLGVERRLHTAGVNKGFLDPFAPENPQQVAHAQAILDDIHQQFIAVVRDGRGKRLKETPDMFSGLFWTGEQAIGLGLADKLGSLEMVARDVVVAPDIVDYTERETLSQRVVKQLGAAMGEGVVKALQSGSLKLH